MSIKEIINRFDLVNKNLIKPSTPKYQAKNKWSYIQGNTIDNQQEIPNDKDKDLFEFIKQSNK